MSEVPCALLFAVVRHLIGMAIPVLLPVVGVAIQPGLVGARLVVPVVPVGATLVALPDCSSLTLALNIVFW